MNFFVMTMNLFTIRPRAAAARFDELYDMCTYDDELLERKREEKYLM